MKRNKKLGVQKREREIVNCCNKLKRDYISPIDLMDFFAEEYKILDKENRKIWNKSQNLYVKSQSLKEIIKMREKLINDMMTEIELLEREFENIYNNDKQKKKIKQQINEKVRHINFMLNH